MREHCGADRRDGGRDVAKALGLGRESRVVVVGSEGATDIDVYTRTVGRTPEEVGAAAAAWGAAQQRARDGMMTKEDIDSFVDAEAERIVALCSDLVAAESINPPGNVTGRRSSSKTSSPTKTTPSRRSLLPTASPTLSCTSIPAGRARISFSTAIWIHLLRGMRAPGACRGCVSPRKTGAATALASAI